MYRLMIEDDEGKNTVVPLPNNRDEITIGRKEGNTIRLTERNVSRQHARLVRTNNGFFIEDKGSYTGVRVNGDRISGRRHIKEGDEIAIGDYHLSIQLEKEAAKESAARESAAKPAKTNGATNGHVTKGTSGTAIIKLPPEREKQLRDGKGAENNIDRARLCLISGNQAGKIFGISRDEVMLGRTEENDIVLNHRSISRNHAKITVSGNTYQIVDLGSANGVRVNGEEYGKIDLRRGDKIDLGHVRLRFIGPGEVFAYDPSMKEDVIGEGESAGGGGGRGLVVVLVVLLLLAGGGAAAYFGGFIGGEAPESVPAAPAVVASAPSAPASPPAPLDDKAKELLAKAETAAAAKKWDEALTLAKEAKSPEKIDLYEKEKAASEGLVECLKARDAGNLESAWASCSVIDPETQTAKEAADEIADVTTKLRDKITKEARAGLSRKDKNGLSTAKEKLDQLGNVLGTGHPDVASLRRDYVALDKELNPEKYAGQADDDGDGIPNPSDDCPTEKGSKADKGCPPDPNKDTDNDGVKDTEDKCRTTAGDAANSGCPAGAPPPENPDSDGDGIIDKLDKCPDDKTNTCAAAATGGQTYDELMKTAQDSFTAKDYSAALKALEEAGKKRSGDLEVVRVRALVYQNNGNAELACKTMKKYINAAGPSASSAARFTSYMDGQDPTQFPSCKR